MGVAVAVGAGIFSVGAQAAAFHAGPAVIISFLIAGIVCGAAVMCYAEFASMIPVAGSAYTCLLYTSHSCPPRQLSVAIRRFSLTALALELAEC